MTAPTSGPVQERTPHRGLVLAAAAFVTLAVLGGAAGLVSEVFQTTDVRDSTLTTSTSTLTVRNDAGNVQLVPSPDDAVHVTAEISRGLEQPKLTEDAGSDGVLLTAECDTERFGATCAVDYTVQVPRSFTVRIEVGSGQVQALGLTGGITVDVQQGSVDLRELSGPVDVRAQSGDVEAVGLSSPTVTVESQWGGIRLDLRTPPGAVRTRTDRGSVDIRLPASTTYRVDATSDDGSARIAVTHDPSSPYAVTAGTGTGDVRIGPRASGPFGPFGPDGPFDPDDPGGPNAVPVPPRPPVPPDAPQAPGFPR